MPISYLSMSCTCRNDSKWSFYIIFYVCLHFRSMITICVCLWPICTLYTLLYTLLVKRSTSGTRFHTLDVQIATIFVWWWWWWLSSRAPFHTLVHRINLCSLLLWLWLSIKMSFQTWTWRKNFLFFSSLFKCSMPFYWWRRDLS